jgi:hypothetical protein
MVDPTSDLAEDIDEASAPSCAACGAPVTGENRRVLTRVVDGEARVRHFCDDDCLAARDGDPAGG